MSWSLHCDFGNDPDHRSESKALHLCGERGDKRQHALPPIIIEKQLLFIPISTSHSAVQKKNRLSFHVESVLNSLNGNPVSIIL